MCENQSEHILDGLQCHMIMTIRRQTKRLIVQPQSSTNVHSMAEREQHELLMPVNNWCQEVLAST